MEDDRDHDYDYEDSTERTALMAGEDGANGQQTKRPRRPSHRQMLSVASLASITSVKVPHVHSGETILNLTCVVLLVAACANGFASIPLTRLVEDVVCHHYYGRVQSFDDPIDEKLCKGESVQSKVAFIFAVSGVCDSIVGFFAAFPWGIAADRIGRKPVFSLALVGIALSVVWAMLVLWFYTIFPTILVAMGSLFLLIGGGNAVLLGILLSMISDVIPEDKRAAAFMRLHISTLIGSLISPILSSAMMVATGPWPVMMVAIACLLFAAVAFMFVPETLKHHDSGQEIDQENHPTGFRAHLSQTGERLKESLSILKSPSLILLLVTCLASAPFAISVLQFLVQFVSTRYDVPIKYTGFVQTTYGVAQIIHALVILPWISNLLLRDSMPKALKMANEQERDLALAKWSFVLIFLGFLILGAAPSISIFIIGLLIMAIGSGGNSLTRSLMSLYVDPEHRSRLFSMVGMVEVIGNIYGAPMMAGLFTLGMNLGGGWLGLPYYALSVLAAITVGIFLFVRVPKHVVGAAPTSEEGRTHVE